jgi:hypothetical protein
MYVIGNDSAIVALDAATGEEVDIQWEQYARNQAKMAGNEHMKSRAQPKAGRGGRALLSGMLALPAMRAHAVVSL